MNIIRHIAMISIWYCVIFAAAFSPASTNAQGFDSAMESYWSGDSDKAVSKFNVLAAQGNVHAKLMIGYIHKDSDVANATEWFARGIPAEAGDEEALLALAWKSLQSAKGGRQEGYIEAIFWFSKAADKGNIPALYEIGKIYSDDKAAIHNFQEAANWYLRAAELNESDAQYELGKMYSFGLGVPKDDNEAFHWYKLSAENNHINSSIIIANMYYDGVGTPVNHELAGKWFHKAADQGHLSAFFKLSQMCTAGDGMPRDGTLACKWMMLASVYGYKEAASFLEKTCKCLPADQMQEAESLVKSWKPKLEGYRYDHGFFRFHDP